MTTPHAAVYGIKKTGAWASGAATLGATDGFRVNWPGWLPQPGRAYRPNPTIIGRAGRWADDKSNILPGGGFTANLTYDGALHRWIAALFGAASATQVGTTAAYTHRYTLHDTLAAINWTAIGRHGTMIFEADALKVDQIQINWRNGEKPTITVTPFIRRLYREAESGATNTDTEIAAITYVEAGGQIKTEQLEVRLAAQSTSTPLASGTAGDVIAPNSLSVTISRGLTDADPTSDSEPYRDEPVPSEDGFTCQVTMDLPDFDVWTYWDNFRDGDALMADIIWTGAALAGSNYKTGIYLPQLQVQNFDPSLGPKVGQVLTFDARVAPSDMSSASFQDEAPYIEAVNGVTAALI